MSEEYRFWCARMWKDHSGRFIRGIDVLDARRQFIEKYGEKPEGLMVL